MRVTTRIVWDIEGNVLEHEWHDYSGPLELCDRSATSEAQNAESTAGGVASQEGSNAANERSQLTPFYKSEMNAKHTFDPSQLGEMLNYAGSATGGTGASAMGEAASQDARTRNTSGFSSALDQNARDRAATMSRANLGVGNEDIMGAKALNQEGAEGMAGLYGVDTGAQLKAMGIQSQDINDQIQAGKSGWFQNLLGAVDTGANLVKAFQPKQ